MLVNENGEAMLSETGLAEFFDVIGLVLYGKAEDIRSMPPECMNTQSYTPQGDIYSFGCLAIGTPFYFVCCAVPRS